MMCEFNCSTEYTEQLIKETIYQYQQGGSALTDDVLQPLCSTYEHPDKETAMHQTLRLRYHLFHFATTDTFSTGRHNVTMTTMTSIVHV